MADKEASQNQTTTQSKQDVESAAAEATMDSKELRRKKRLKCLGYVVAFAVFQTAIILIFVLTIMKIRTPKFRVREVTIQAFGVGTPENPSFNSKMQVQLGVKNANFGNYKFHNSTVVFYYRGSPAGVAVVNRTKAGWRSTKKLNVVVDISTNGLPSNSQFPNDLNSGTLTLNSQSTLNGKVELIFIFKKKKSINMDCNLTINLKERTVPQITCK